MSPVRLPAFQNAMHGSGSPAMGGPFSAHDPPLTPKPGGAPIILGMRAHRSVTQRLATGALPIALWAALPLVQWCPPCDLRAADCPLGAALAAPVTHDPLASDCAPPGACARRSAQADACAGLPVCPVASMAQHGRHHRPGQGGTFCVSAPNGGAGVRPHAPRLDSPIALPAIAAAEIQVPLPRVAMRFTPEAAARPPTRAAWRPPPVRGPPTA